MCLLRCIFVLFFFTEKSIIYIYVKKVYRPQIFVTVVYKNIIYSKAFTMVINKAQYCIQLN